MTTEFQVDRETDIRMAAEWPPYPGMYPTLIQEGAMMSITVWDADISWERIKADLARLTSIDYRLYGYATAQRLNFGTAKEIADIAASFKGGVMFDLEGCSEATIAAFEAEAGLHGAISVSVR